MKVNVWEPSSRDMRQFGTLLGEDKDFEYVLGIHDVMIFHKDKFKKIKRHFYEKTLPPHIWAAYCLEKLK